MCCGDVVTGVVDISLEFKVQEVEIFDARAKLI
jgi:hypothetical protein